jgi:hypothetical protein
VKRRAKKRSKKRPLLNPVYRFGSDVKRLLRRAGGLMTKAEQRLKDQFSKKKESK